MTEPVTVTVCSRLPHDLVAEFGGKSVVFRGAKALDPTDGSKHLIEGFGMTHGVDAAWFAGWEKQSADFAPLKNGVIYSTARDVLSAQAEAAEMAPEIKSGFERVTPEKMGVQPAAKED